MKKFILTFGFLLFCGSQLFSQELTFQYDAAGNQIVREFICINCPPVPPVIISKNPEDDKLFTNDTKTKDALSERKLTAYPNPLTEILNLKWQASDEAYIKIIEVYNLVGVKIYSQKYSVQQSETTIPFLEQIAGVYLVKAYYSDGKQEVLKVIKQ